MRLTTIVAHPPPVEIIESDRPVAPTGVMAQSTDQSDGKGPDDRHGFLVTGAERYGVGTVAINLATGLAQRGMAPLVIALDEGDLVEQCRALNLPVEVLGLPQAPSFAGGPARVAIKMFRQRLWQRSAVERLTHCLRRKRVRSLAFQWPTHIALAGRATRQSECTACWLMPNEVSRRWWGLNRRYYLSIIARDRITVLPNSRYTGRSLSPAFEDHALYLGIDTARFDPNRVKGVSCAALGIDRQAVVFGVFARIDASKGQHRLWQAMQPILDDYDAHLLLVGTGSDEAIDRLKGLGATEHAAARLHITGWTSEPESYYPVVDVAVNSRIDPEPFGLSVIEAMAMRKPVLAHASGGPAETVLDGETGWHVMTPEVEDFRRGLQRVLGDRDRWASMGDAARRRAVDMFSLEQFADRYLKALEAAKA